MEALRAHCPACDPKIPARPRAPWVALASALLAVVVPKCPLCLAAYLSIFGVSVGVAGVAVRVLRPLAIVVCALALGVVLVRALARFSGSARTRR